MQNPHWSFQWGGAILFNPIYFLIFLMVKGMQASTGQQLLLLSMMMGQHPPTGQV